MKVDRGLDIYQRLSRNRLRLSAAFSAFFLSVMALSAIIFHLLYRPLRLGRTYWLTLAVFWLLFLLFALLRYALSGRRLFKCVETLPPWKTSRKLEGALQAAVLAAGMVKRVRLYEVPHADINAFSLSLPDGSFALFATQGLADKLPEREREAVMAHEIAHMQAGDSLLHTAMLCVVGQGTLSRIQFGWRVKDKPFLRHDYRLPPVASFALFLLTCAFPPLILFASAHLSPTQLGVLIIAFSLTLMSLFLALTLPLFVYKLLQLFLDREREYAADMQAVFWTRDPAAVYGAVKGAAEDERDVLLLPPYLDALLFHPVIDYLYYRPFRTQPAMVDRLERLREAFPEVAL